MKDEDLTSTEVRPGVTGRFDHGSLSRRPDSCGSEASVEPKSRGFIAEDARLTFQR